MPFCKEKLSGSLGSTDVTIFSTTFSPFAKVIYLILQEAERLTDNYKQFAQNIYQAKLLSIDINQKELELICDLLIGYAYMKVGVAQKAEIIFNDVLNTAERLLLFNVICIARYLKVKLLINNSEKEKALLIINDSLADIRKNGKRILALAVSVVICAVCFAIVVVPKAIQYPIRSFSYYGYYQNIRNTLDQVPDDVSVTASSVYTAYLSDREILYDVRHASITHLLETEYIVLNVSSVTDYNQYAFQDKKGFETLTKILEKNGYREFAKLDGILVIYCRA